MEITVTRYEGPNKALVDVAIRVKIWIRPELQRRQFESIRRARPTMLFLDSDGGRNDEEWAIIRECRGIFEEIDWECEVHRIFHSSNQGLYASGFFSSKYIWKHVEYAIFLEDDVQFSDSFIPWCAEMLNRYANDTRVLAVCGMNHEGISEGVPYDYFFSREASIWGVATWKRTWELRDIKYADDAYLRSLVKDNARLNPGLIRATKGYAESDVYEGHVAGSEFWLAFSALVTNQLYIVPTRNMICNVGCTADSAHADVIKLLPKGTQRLFNMQTYDCSFPLVHPKYVAPDIRYQKSVYRIMAIGHPLVHAWRKISRALRILIYRGPSALISKINTVLNRQES